MCPGLCVLPAHPPYEELRPSQGGAVPRDTPEDGAERL